MHKLVMFLHYKTYLRPQAYLALYVSFVNTVLVNDVVVRLFAMLCVCERTLEHIKKGVATPLTCNQSLVKQSGCYSIRCSTFTQTPPKQSK